MGWKIPPMQLFPENADYSLQAMRRQRRRPGGVPESTAIAARHSTNGDAMGFLAGKRLLITGVLNNRSIAYGIARACHREGAELAFSYVRASASRSASPSSRAEFGSEPGLRVRRGRRRPDRPPVRRSWASAGPQFDGFVHAIGFAPREAIAGDFLDGLSRENFRIAHDISAYSFPAMAKAAAAAACAPVRALLTLTYLGAVRATCPTTTRWAWPRPRWNRACASWRSSLGARGVRVNGISAGPIKTLAASGIKDFGKLLA